MFIFTWLRVCLCVLFCFFCLPAVIACCLFLSYASVFFSVRFRVYLWLHVCFVIVLVVLEDFAIFVCNILIIFHIIIIFFVVRLLAAIVCYLILSNVSVFFVCSLSCVFVIECML